VPSSQHADALTSAVSQSFPSGGFSTAFDAALANDAEHLATRHELRSRQQAVPIARAQLVDAPDQRDVAERTGARISGLEPTPLRGLREGTRAQPLCHDSASSWIDAALAQYPNLQARRYALDSARYEVERNRAGHLPRVDFLGSTADAQNETISTLNRQVRQ
jgi:protease secretion system outer membrane protein